MIRSTTLCILALLLHGCAREDCLPTAPTGLSRLTAPGDLLFVADGDGSLPGRVEIRTVAGRWRIGPWPGSIPTTALEGATELRVLPPNGWYPMRVPLFPTRPSRVTLLAQPESWSVGPYRDALDLLAELIVPFDGPRVRRWTVSTLRVSLPSGTFAVDYRGTLEEAIAGWNERLGIERLAAVPPGEPAEVRCEVSEDGRLGYTHLLERDRERRNVAMRIHLSPRWLDGAERYVRRVWYHELAHVLGLWGHSLDPAHILYHQAVFADAPHPHEVELVRWLWSMPHGTHLGWYRVPTREFPPAQPARPAVPRGSSLLTGCAGAMADGTGESRPPGGRPNAGSPDSR
jgi:hypothetical protein